MRDIINNVNMMTDEQHAQVYKFLETQDVLHNAKISNEGMFLDLSSCDKKSIFDIANYVNSMCNIDQVYILTNNSYILLSVKN